MQEEFLGGGMNPMIAPPYLSRCILCGRIAKLLEDVRRRQGLVIYTASRYSPEDELAHHFQTRLCGPFCIEGKPGVEIVPEVAPRPGEQVINKKGYSPFFQTELVEVLRQEGVEGVVLAGVKTDVCVCAAAIDAFQLGFHVAVVQDCCSTGTRADQRRFLIQMRHYAAAEIIRSTEVGQYFASN